MSYLIVFDVLLFTIFIVTVCSCSFEGSEISQEKVIGFRSKLKNTRVIEVNDISGITNFCVSAVWTKDATNYEENFMNKVLVERHGTDWDYSPTHYFPSYGYLNFFAYTPATSVGLKSFQLIGSAFENLTIEYEVTTDHHMQEDFLVAAALEQKTNPVNLDFNHMLSQIAFEAQSNPNQGNPRIKNVILHNLYREGTLQGITNISIPETKWNWNNQQRKEDYSIYLPNPVSVSDAYKDLVDPNVGNLMLLPQEVSIGNNELYTQAEVDADPSLTQEKVGQPKDLDQNFYVAVHYNYEKSGNQINEVVYFPLYKDLGADGQVGGTGADEDTPFVLELGKSYTFLFTIEPDMTRSIDFNSRSSRVVVNDTEVKFIFVL